MSLILGTLLTGVAAIAGTILCPSPTSLRKIGDRVESFGPAVALAVCLAMMGRPAMAGETVRGRAIVVDGSTLAIDGRTVTLSGIVTPAPDATCWDVNEVPYACGRKVRAELIARIGTEALTCEPRERSDDRHTEAMCRARDEDLGDWMIAHGYAMPAQDAPASYKQTGDRAWGRRAGLWGGVFDDPRDWRQAAR